MFRTILGRHNASLKLARRLQKKKYRAERGYFVAEGWDVLSAALEAGVQPVEILVREDIVARLPSGLIESAEADRLDIGVCSAKALGEVSLLGGAADVVAVFPERRGSLRDWDVATQVTLYLYRVGDPGNVGTLVRSALAFGAGGVACSPQTSDPFGPRALRAGMGAQFLLPVAGDVTPEDLVAHLRARASADGSRPVPILVLADPRGEVDSRTLRSLKPSFRPHRGLGGGVILVLGSERGELPALEEGPWAKRLRVAVPQRRFDSLNVAMAGGILLYELQDAPVEEGDGCAEDSGKL